MFTFYRVNAPWQVTICRWGRFRLDGIPAAPRGLPQIEVTFDIDANGIINVTARDKATGKEQKVVITASTNLNKSDIDRMVEEAKKHQSEDSRRKELVEARNNADSTVYQVEKNRSRIWVTSCLLSIRPASKKRSRKVKTVMQKDDLQVIRSKTEELTMPWRCCQHPGQCSDLRLPNKQVSKVHRRRTETLLKANSKRLKIKGCGENHSLIFTNRR